MVRLGILTFHRCVNYGSYWQARCLLEWLRSRGFEPVLLDYVSQSTTLAELKCAYRPQLPAPTVNSDYPLYRRKIEAFERAIEALPLSAPFLLDEPGSMDEFDIVIVGSDEVWNLCHPWYGGRTVFWGENLRAKDLVSYAASFGNYDAGAGLEERWASRLQRFKAVSVRDLNSKKLIDGALFTNTTLVADPCLLVKPAHGPRPQRLPQSYLLLYGHNFSDHFVKGVREFARSAGLVVVSIGYRNDWADEVRLDAGPSDFADAMFHAEAVATNFFHGCIFSLQFDRPFVCEAAAYRSNKINDLLELVNARERMAAESWSSDDFGIRLTAHNSSDVNDAIDTLKRNSEAYLTGVLSVNFNGHSSN